MAKQVKKVSKVKTKKKRWFSIFAPGFLGQKEIGESYLGEASQAISRIMKVNLRDLTGGVRDQNIHVSLKISGVSGNNLQTEVVGYAYMPFYVKKLGRKNNGLVDDSFVLETKDDKKVRLKPLVITVFKINKSVKTAIRKRMMELLNEEVSKISFDSLVCDLLRYKLQMEFKKKLNKICPVREVLMRKIKLEEGKKVKVTVVKKREVKEEEKKESTTLTFEEKKSK